MKITLFFLSFVFLGHAHAQYWENVNDFGGSDPRTVHWVRNQPYTPIYTTSGLRYFKFYTDTVSIFSLRTKNDNPHRLVGIDSVTGALKSFIPRFLTDEVDGDITNELQVLGGAGRTLTLSIGGGQYTLPLTSYDSLLNKPTIPTNTNQLANGAGFISSYTETDPQFDTKFSTKTTTGLAEGTNLYFTNTRARASVSLTTTGSGAATYNNSTGALNIPTFSGSPVRVYNGAGQVNQSIKIWAATVTPTTGNGYSVDISSAGFGTILSVYALSEFNTGTTTTMRNVEIKSVSTSAVVVNIAIPNATAIALLGLTLLGVPTFLPSGTGTNLHVTVIGY